MLLPVGTHNSDIFLDGIAPHEFEVSANLFKNIVPYAFDAAMSLICRSPIQILGLTPADYNVDIEDLNKVFKY